VTDPLSSPAWHALLGPLPNDAVPERNPVASPEVLATPAGAAVAGWEQLLLHLSAGSAGSRTILAVLDPDGTLLSASDGVLYVNARDGGPAPADPAAPATFLQLSVGGRFEADGSFHGTRWHSVAVQREAEEEPEWDSTPSSPSEEDAAALRDIAEELIRRQPARR
jgi:hypothetical protein